MCTPTQQGAIIHSRMIETFRICYFKLIKQIVPLFTFTAEFDGFSGVLVLI